MIVNMLFKYKCDRFEQKQPYGWVLTNLLTATPLRLGSTFIDRFSKLIPQRNLLKSAISWYITIVLENPYLNVEPGRKVVAFSGFVKTHPYGCFCSKRSQILLKQYLVTVLSFFLPCYATLNKCFIIVHVQRGHNYGKLGIRLLSNQGHLKVNDTTQ